MECHYCKKKLSSKSALNQHQKNTKYCLKIQGKNVTKGAYPCTYCKKDFYNKHHLINHQDSCKANTPMIQKFRKQIQSYRQQICVFQQQIATLEDNKESYRQAYEELAKTCAQRPTSTTNNTINNNTLNLAVFNKTQEDIKRIIEEKFGRHHLLEGQKGAADFVCSHILDDEDGHPQYIVTDRSRGNCKYKLTDGEIVTDHGMVGITGKVHPSFKKKSLTLMDAEETLEDNKLFEGFQEILDMDNKNVLFVKQMVKRLA